MMMVPGIRQDFLYLSMCGHFEQPDTRLEPSHTAALNYAMTALCGMGWKEEECEVKEGCRL